MILPCILASAIIPIRLLTSYYHLFRDIIFLQITHRDTPILTLQEIGQIKFCHRSIDAAESDPNHSFPSTLSAKHHKALPLEFRC